MFRALAHRDFRYLQAGTQATQLGNWVQGIGRGWLVYELTQSPFQLGLVTFFAGIAALATTPIGGTLVDRVDRRRLMTLSQAALALIALVLALLIVVDRVEIWHVYVAAFLSGGLSSINQPARQAMVYDLVGREDLPNAIALNSITMNAARVVGPSLGGLLLATSGVEAAFFFQAASLAVALWATLVMREGGRADPSAQRSAFFEAMVTGFRYAVKDRTMAVLLAMAMVAAVLGWPYIAMMPAYAAEVLHMGSGGYGLVMAAVGIGAVVGAVLVAAATDIRWKGKLLLLSMAVNGAALMALGLPPFLALTMLILVAIGLSSAVQMAMNQTLIQLHVEDEYRGRMSAIYFLGFGLQPVGALPAGAIGERWGVQAGLFALGAALTLFIVVMALANRRLSRL